VRRRFAKANDQHEGKKAMNNDKVFAIYACTLVAGIASVITASLFAGLATLPSPLMFVEHLAMSVTFRAAYKSFAGPVWWPYPSARAEAVAGEAAVLGASDGAAHA
jgi:hypothetical protein